MANHLVGLLASDEEYAMYWEPGEGGEVIEAVQENARQIAKLQAEQIRLLAQFVKLRPGRPGREFSEFAPDELSAAMRWTRTYALAKLRAAQVMTDHVPEVLDALDDGHLDDYQATILADAVHTLPPATAHQVTAYVLARAEGRNSSELRRVIRRAVLRYDTEQAETRRRRARDQRKVDFTPYEDGMATLLALLPANEALTIHRRLDAFAREAAIPGDCRTHVQRRADAFVDLMLDPGLGEININVDVAIPADALTTTPTPTTHRNPRSTSGPHSMRDPSSASGPRNASGPGSASGPRGASGPRSASGPYGTADPGTAGDPRRASGPRTASGACGAGGPYGTGDPGSTGYPGNTGDPRSASGPHSAGYPHSAGDPGRTSGPRGTGDPRCIGGPRGSAAAPGVCVEAPRVIDALADEQGGVMSLSSTTASAGAVRVTEPLASTSMGLARFGRAVVFTSAAEPEAASRSSGPADPMACDLAATDPVVTDPGVAAPAMSSAVAVSSSAELAGYGAITGGQARELAVGISYTGAAFADPRWRRLVTRPLTGDLLEASPGTYRPAPLLAEFVRVRDQYCVFPGCSWPARGCDIDHREPYPRGATTADNLNCLCRHHHRLKHEAGWTLRKRGRSYVWIDPGGIEYVKEPEPAAPPPDPDGERPPF